MHRKHVWAIVALIGLYVAAQLIADVAATKFVEIGGVVMQAGTFVLALTFTLRDMVHKRLGKEWARAAIVIAAALNLLLSGYLWVAAQLPAPSFFGLSEAWGSIFALVPAIVLGSIAAELVSELIDTEVYHVWRSRFPDLPQWSRVLASNAVSIPVDSLVFSLLAFVVLPPLFGADTIPLFDALARVASGQVLYKVVVTLVSMPGIYLVKDEKLPALLVTRPMVD